jgi:hypothetical protein
LRVSLQAKLSARSLADETTHPKTGARGMVAPPPASKAVLAKLAKLAGLQREAEEELKTVAALSTELANLRRKLPIAEKAQTGVPEAEVQRRIKEAIAAAAPAGSTVSKALLADVEKISAGLQLVQEQLKSAGAAGVTTPAVRHTHQDA